MKIRVALHTATGELPQQSVHFLLYFPPKDLAYRKKKDRTIDPTDRGANEITVSFISLVSQRRTIFSLAVSFFISTPVAYQAAPFTNGTKGRKGPEDNLPGILYG